MIILDYKKNIRYRDNYFGLKCRYWFTKKKMVYKKKFLVTKFFFFVTNNYSIYK